MCVPMLKESDSVLIGTSQFTTYSHHWYVRRLSDCLGISCDKNHVPFLQKRPIMPKKFEKPELFVAHTDIWRFLY